MKIGKRNILTFLKGISSIDNYKAILKFNDIHDEPLKALYKEIFSTGKYPQKIKFKTPLGKFKVKLYSPADFSTFNLIFCRQDYYVPKKLKTIVDIGSNIGLSTIYWLTRNPHCKVYCFEPSKSNLIKFKNNLKNFKSRYFLQKHAVSNYTGIGYLHIEKSGVYSSLHTKTEGHKYVGREKCKIIDINQCLEKILKKNGEIDVLKIDNEGEEIKTISSINKRFWKFIKCINIDNLGARKYIPSNFVSNVVGSAQRFYKKSI